MRVTLDELECPHSAGCVGEVLREARRFAESRGRVIIDVRVDGLEWGDQLTSDEALRGSARTVELRSADRRSLLTGTLAEAMDALDTADRLHVESAEAIQRGQTTQGLDVLNEAIAIWLNVQDAVRKIAALESIDLDLLTPAHAGARGTIADLAQLLERVRTAIANHDPVTLSDTLLYDMPAVTARWRDLVQVLRSRVEES